MTEVKDGTAADLESITDALVSAFHDDPVMLYLFEKPAKREKQQRALFMSEAKRALTKGAVHTTADGAAKGAAIWMAPGATTAPFVGVTVTWTWTPTSSVELEELFVILLLV